MTVKDGYYSCNNECDYDICKDCVAKGQPNEAKESEDDSEKPVTAEEKQAATMPPNILDEKEQVNEIMRKAN